MKIYGFQKPQKYQNSNAEIKKWLNNYFFLFRVFLAKPKWDKWNNEDHVALKARFNYAELSSRPR